LTKIENKSIQQINNLFNHNGGRNFKRKERGNITSMGKSVKEKEKKMSRKIFPPPRKGQLLGPTFFLNEV